MWNDPYNLRLWTKLVNVQDPDCRLMAEVSGQPAPPRSVFWQMRNSLLKRLNKKPVARGDDFSRD